MIDPFSNTLLTSGAALVVLNAILSSAKDTLSNLAGIGRNRFITTIDITNQDNVFYWMQSWMDQNIRTDKNKAVTITAISGPSDAADPIIKLSPAPGFHFFTYKGRFFWMVRSREKSATSGLKHNAWIETISLSTIGGTRQMVYDLVLDMYRSHRVSEKTSIQVMAYNGYHWSDACAKSFRPPETLVLKEGQMQSILDDLDTFKRRRDWYLRMGIPWKRGYLLHGEPGNGKSSLILVMATHLLADVHIVNLADQELTDAKLMDIVATTNENSIVVFEEIDTIFEGRVVTNKEHQQISFGGLLNAIDGLGAPEGRIFVMTTNHPEKLDPALIRPGRADIKMELSNANSYQVMEMYKRFYPDKKGGMLRSDDTGLSMAHVQEIAIEHVDDPLGFLKEIQQRMNVTRDSDTGRDGT